MGSLLRLQLPSWLAPDRKSLNQLLVSGRSMCYNRIQNSMFQRQNIRKFHLNSETVLLIGRPSCEKTFQGATTKQPREGSNCPPTANQRSFPPAESSLIIPLASSLKIQWGDSKRCKVLRDNLTIAEAQGSQCGKSERFTVVYSLQ